MHGKRVNFSLLFILAIALVSFLKQEAIWAGAVTTQSGRHVLLRGIGWSPWHFKEHWNLSQATIAQDTALLKEAHINCLRTWGPAKRQTVEGRYQQGFYMVPTVGRSGLTKSRFADGTEGGIAFADPQNIARFRELCREAAEEVAGAEGCPVLLLGNEYSLVGQDAKGNWGYLGFDEVTQTQFARWLQERFGTVERFNAACGTNFASLSEVQAPGEGKVRYQWWLFLREVFDSYMRAGYEAVKAVAPALNVSYAKLMGLRWDPATEDARLQFLEVQGDNLYWFWHKNWAWFNAYLNDLISHTPQRPVLITETGFLSIPLGPERAARLTKQVLMNLFMHSQVAGVCIYVYCDEWYWDGNLAEQAPGESWGILTADRQKKPSYEAVREIYGLIEQRLEPLLIAARDEPAVWVSSQSLDGLLGGSIASRHVLMKQALYNLGVPFRALHSEDLVRLPELNPPKLILCDDVLLNDWRAERRQSAENDAGATLEQYVRNGGQVLYVAEKPFSALYGQLSISEKLAQVKAEAPRRARQVVPLGRGRLIFVPRAQLTNGEARTLVREFLADFWPKQPVRLIQVSPPDKAREVFWRILPCGEAQLLWVVNMSESPVEVAFHLSNTRAMSLGTDGKIMYVGTDEMRLAPLDTYAVFQLEQKGETAAPRK